MSPVSSLPSSSLHATFDPQRIAWNDSREIPPAKHAKSGKSPFQPRAMQALDLALQIKAAGYHVFLSGEADLGRTYMLLSYLKPRAKQMPAPPDLVYVQNFADQDSPILLALPAGQGKKLKESIRDFIGHVSENLERRLDTINFVRQRARLMAQFQNVRSNLLHKMNSEAANKGFSLDMDDNGGITLSPLLKGKKPGEDDYMEMDTAFRLDLKKKGDSLAKNLMGYMKQLSKAEESLRDDERNLEQKAMIQTLDSLFSPFGQKLLKTCSAAGIQEYLEALRRDITDNTDSFLHRERDDRPEDGHAQQSEDFFKRYEVNLFVDNSAVAGAPVVVEDNPTSANLLGCIERESELGALVTDFTLIRAGSLHRANGGFLILHVDDLLQHPLAWEGLLRALRSCQARIEDGGEMFDAPVRTKGLHPQALALDMKVVLVGCEESYENLLLHDDRFTKLFRIKAHMTDVAERTAPNIKIYLSHIATIIKEGGLLPFDASALAWLIDLGSHLCEDQKKLSLKFPLLRELMIEAAALAQIRGIETVNSAIMEEAYADRIYRANLVEEEFMEDYDREMIKVRTSGWAVGQVNGLSVTWHGDFEFGLPHCISCTVGVGHEGIIDLEREAELGGPIHTKAMMILKSYLTSVFAQKKPLVLSASLYFEQSYAGIEGDSASGAELAALLSALADVPMRLDLAFTGAVSHSGQIMAVGGVTRKIEGFYKVCARHGLTGTQGVIIPHDNIDRLMLSPEVLASVDKGEFAVYSVRNIEEALFLLSGKQAGKRRKDGSFTPGSLYDMADRRLERLGCHAQNAFRKRRGE